MNTADVIVIGGGMVGLATAYQLACKGVKTILLQAGDLGGGTSSANAGRAQVSEGPLDDLNLFIIRAGLKRFDTLEEELGYPFEWHRLGYLCLINSEQLWQRWETRAKILTKNGIPTELLDHKMLAAAEPHLNPQGFLGAAFSLEGMVNPFLFSWAYARASRRKGALLIPQSPVDDFTVSNGNIAGIHAGGEWYSAAKVVFTCGAWTRPVLKRLNIDFPLFFTHAEAFITEPLPPIMHNTIGLADFYERIHGKQQAAAIGVGPHLNGGLLVTEAVTKFDEIRDAPTEWGISMLAEELVKILPVLKDAHVLRAWGSPTPFMVDEQPAIGWLPQLENAFIGAGFLQTITALPLVSEWMAQLICGEATPFDLGLFSPARFFGGGNG